MVTTAAGPRPAPGPGGDPGRLQLTTLAGWRGFAAESPAVPALLPEPAWARLDDGERADYDDERIAHHSRLLIVATPVVASVITQGRRLAQLNSGAHFGRCGLIVSGPPRTGKTTAVTQLGKTIQAIRQRRHPGSPGDVPVIYVTVPPAATAKMIAVEFARFLALPVSAKANITTVIESVCGVALDTRVGLVSWFSGWVLLWLGLGACGRSRRW